MIQSVFPRSLAHEYELYVEAEIEDYKDSIPRSKLLSIGDEAVRQLAEQPQFALTEVVLVDEVDRIIRRRLRIPAYRTWARTRMKQLVELRRPEHWGLRPDAAIVRAIAPSVEGHVLLAGTPHAGSALYLAAHGCLVTAVDDSADLVDRVLAAAAESGLTPYVQAFVSPLVDWEPLAPLSGVICSKGVLSGLDASARARLLDVWQGATQHGGVHLVDPSAMSEDELRTQYHGWAISIEKDADAQVTFMARKPAS
jgi:hypothetical protein